MFTDRAVNIAATAFKSAEVFLTVFDPTTRTGQKVRPLCGLSGAFKAVPDFEAK
jgi:hypothetical protein